MGKCYHIQGESLRIVKYFFTIDFDQIKYVVGTFVLLIKLMFGVGNRDKELIEKKKIYIYRVYFNK